ncbi:MAG: hypothetical protein PHV66_03040 [Bacteroidales bacterium]|nr:hypothetical protein [Bacteroidales bacterium]
MKKNYFTLLLIFILSSCVVKDNGDLGFATWFIVLFWSFILFIIILLIKGDKDEKKTRMVLAEKGLSQSDFSRVGHYVGGHPDQNEEILRVTVRDDGEDLDFHDHFGGVGMPKYKFAIPKQSIKDVTIEDASTIEKKVTLGRIILVGVFALAWRKKKKNEVAFVVINWNDGRFDHSTTFLQEGQNAMQEANTIRNHLIKIITG